MPDWRGTEKEAITLLDLLEMRPGLQFVEDYVDDGVSHALAMLFGDGKADYAALRGGAATRAPARDRVELLVGHDQHHLPHPRRDRRRRTGRDGALPPRAAVRAVRHVDSAEPRFDAAGTWVGSTYVYATARDFARFGELYRNDGVAASGERLLPAGWADHGRVFVAHDPEAAGRYGFDYGRHWWMWPEFPGSIAAHGYEGQFVVVVPDRQLTVVHLGKTVRELQPPLVAALGRPDRLVPGDGRIRHRRRRVVD